MLTVATAAITTTITTKSAANPWSFFMRYWAYLSRCLGLVRCWCWCHVGKQEKKEKKKAASETLDGMPPKQRQQQQHHHHHHHHQQQQQQQQHQLYGLRTMRRLPSPPLDALDVCVWTKNTEAAPQWWRRAADLHTTLSHHPG
ncbi:hypothetical protein ACJQWK_09741 [Exserohilum turcicum]